MRKFYRYFLNRPSMEQWRRCFYSIAFRYKNSMEMKMLCRKAKPVQVHCKYRAHTASTLRLNGKSYNCDELTNVTPKILSHVGKNLHLKEFHPLQLMCRRIIRYMFSRYVNARGNPLFSVCDDLSPLVTVKQNFDSLLVPPDHVSRSKSDTYYINSEYLLRAHTSAHQAELILSGLDNFLVVGDVYRRDEIDSVHYPVFHQMEGVRLFAPQDLYKEVSLPSLFHQGDRTDAKQESHTPDVVEKVEKDLKKCLEGLALHLFGRGVEYRWVTAYFPFTHPSWELEVLHEGDWTEILGCGIMEQELLVNSGAGDRIGWAFGLGLERLAMKLYGIPDIRLFWSEDEGFLSQFEGKRPNDRIKYKPISIYPSCKNDISFWLPEGCVFSPNDFYDLVRTVGGDLTEQVKLVDEFYHPKKNMHSHCYRITYRSMERTLTQQEVNDLHKKIEDTVTQQFGVSIR